MLAPTLLLLTLCLVHWFITQYTYSRLMRLGSRWALFPLIGPGIITHELSHYLVCKGTLATVTRVKLFDFDNASAQFGGVSYRHTSNPLLRFPINFLVGIAPLPGALLCMLALTNLLLPDYLLLSVSVALNNALVYTVTQIEFWQVLFVEAPALLNAFELNAKTVAWIVVVGLISHGAAPSIRDYKLAMPFGVIVFLLLWVIGGDVLNGHIIMAMQLASVAMLLLIIPLALWATFMAMTYQILKARE